MKLNKTTLIAALALGGLLTMGTALNAQVPTTNTPAATPPAGGPPARRGGAQLTIEQLTKALTLTDDQKPKVQAALDDQRKKMSELRQDASLSTEDRRTKMTAIRTDFTAKMKEILTADQFAQFQKMPQPGRRNAPPVAAPAATPPAAN
jgi:Spy/CpxP family protein refolding chaperone